MLLPRTARPGAPISTLLLLGGLVLLAAGAPLDAQVVTGVVRDAESGAALAGVAVAQVDAVRTVRTVETDEDGRFALQLQGPPPYQLRVDRIGYTARTLPLEALPPGGEPIEILLTSGAFALPEIVAEGQRERFQHVFGRFAVTEEGLYDATAIQQGCVYMAMDSVVIKDPKLYGPEAGAYAPARHLRFDVELMMRHRDRVYDPRLLRDAWPCGVATVRWFSREWMFRDRSTPELDATEYVLVEKRHLDLPDTSVSIPLRAPDGRVAVAAPEGAAVHIHAPGAEGLTRLRSVEGPGRREGHGGGFGWIGDTLWVANAALERVSLVPPGESSRVVRRGIGGVLEPDDPESGARALHGVVSADVPPPLPTPMADGTWLWVPPAPDQPFPPRIQDEPPPRSLIALDEEWRLGRVLALLRPGPEMMEVEFARAPIVLGVQPFADHPMYAVSPDGAHVTVVRRRLEKAVWWDIYTVTRIDMSGDTIFHVERTPPLVPLTREIHWEAVEEYASHPDLARMVPLSSLRNALLRDMIRHPPFLPPVTAVEVGADGSTWLRGPDDWSGTVRWDVLDETGAAVRNVTTDRRLALLGAEPDRVWGAAPDDMDNVRIVQYGFELAPEPVSEPRPVISRRNAHLPIIVGGLFLLGTVPLWLF